MCRDASPGTRSHPFRDGGGSCASPSESVTPRVRTLLSSISEGREETQGDPGAKVLCTTYTHAPRMANAVGIAASS